MPIRGLFALYIGDQKAAVILGLIGTDIGFIIALSGVDGRVSSNPEEVSKMVSTLIQGMSVALYTTLVGSICSVWLNICYQIM